MREMGAGFQSQLWGITIQSAMVLAEGIAPLCQSPIEVDFGVAFIMTVDAHCNEPCMIARRPADIDDTPAFAGPHFYIEPQSQIGNHRVDFLVGCSWGKVKAIVECDGREWHHSTREQIERDRQRDKELEEAGFKVFRFPGTQIFNAPFDCATDVVHWLTQNNERPE